MNETESGHSSEEEKKIVDALFLAAERAIADGDLDPSMFKGVGRMLLRIGGGDRLDEFLEVLQAHAQHSSEPPDDDGRLEHTDDEIREGLVKGLRIFADGIENKKFKSRNVTWSRDLVRVERSDKDTDDFVPTGKYRLIVEYEDGGA